LAKCAGPLSMPMKRSARLMTSAVSNMLSLPHSDSCRGPSLCITSGLSPSSTTVTGRAAKM
jgi:hypothetical protein